MRSSSFSDRATAGSSGGSSRFAFRHEPPPIPDHEVLRCIGKGSYGEVWMARGVTGALRAVKVVHRGDFELERTFEREFEGIRSFEPISRQHPGLVHVLHVGRNTEHGFYYYVMELADDQVHAQEIHPAEYVPRTLGAEVRANGKLPLDDCIRHGLALSEALHHLHTHGLAHRDIKPSNVIFVNGQAKLADIGLVAESGKRTFVGTEGFVPPEGPGTTEADVYSLGMVLYEITTGKDRMEFPELPTNLGPSREREKWLALNEVVCRACAPLPKRRYASAAAMAEDLQAIGVGEYRPARLPRVVAIPAISAALAGVVVALVHPDEGHAVGGVLPEVPAAVASARPGEVRLSPPDPVAVTIRSQPSGAEVFLGDRRLGETPLEGRFEPGEYPFVLRRKDYRETTLDLVLRPETPADRLVELEFWSPPVPGRPWRNNLGMSFQPRGDEHVAVRPTEYEDFIQRTGDDLLEGEVIRWTDPEGKTAYVVYVPREDAELFAEWLTSRDRQFGFLPDDYRYRVEPFAEGIVPTIDDPENDYLAFRCVAYRQEFGSIRLVSTPAMAEVFQDGARVGRTPFTVARIEAGEVRFELRLPGYRITPVEAVVKRDETTNVEVALEESGAAVFSKPWENSLRMRLVPLGDDERLLMSAFETRVKDYEAFVADASHAPPADPGFAQEPTHPVVNVSREDAEAFCRWLTQRERRRGLIELNHRYRLPTDEEWSSAVGIRQERGFSPAERSERTFGVFPWGVEWPPPKDAGNFADLRFRRALQKGDGDAIVGYDDGFVHTAPAGTYMEVAGGLHDLSGNVWEWVEDPFGGAELDTMDHGVLRGGSWADAGEDRLRSTARLAVPSDAIDHRFGFRCVLENVPVVEPMPLEADESIATTPEPGPDPVEDGAPDASGPARSTAIPAAGDASATDDQPSEIETDGAN